MTRKIYLLVHKPNTYTDTRKVLHAYESEAEAAETVERWGAITNGVLEIQPVELIGAAKQPDGWRHTAVAPSFEVPGIVLGKSETISRAELP